MLAQVLRDRPVWEEWTEPEAHADAETPAHAILFRDDEDEEDEDFLGDPTLDDEEDEDLVEDDDFLDDDLDGVEADEEFDDDEDEDL